ncbi:hypothetical protein M413DRAFT_448901 [Hebeloma cylindrosporum]|uniref:F-box domain-containing protein n=1 Tax=Hebeloma cylindrosporum TaxID=76867 RepID=A0A0C3BJ69_HEBCY|nr:hypothetical protein M413DRAFT_448901 [Hebeloma cylindrosporum h7]
MDEIDLDEDLLSLAATSRLFHQLSLRSYFLRHGFDPTSKNLLLNSYEGSFKVVSALAISLDLRDTSIDSLVYDSGQEFLNRAADELVQEVRLLTRYVSKLSTVGSVFIRLATYYQPKEWEWKAKEAIIPLLSTVLSKSCRDIHIATSSFSSYETPPKLSNLTKAHWPPKTQPAGGHLKTFSIQTFPPFLRQFYFHTLRANNSVLRSLSFTKVFGGGDEWATMLANLHFPRLAKLHISFVVFPRDLLIKFLTQHPTLAEFEYHHIRYKPTPKYPARFKKGAFEQLRTLTVSPEHLLSFLPPLSQMPLLTEVVIKIDEMGPSFFGPLDDSLRRLAVCTNKITLSLEINRTGVGFGAWFHTIFRNGLRLSERPEPLLHCVEMLVMDNADWGFTDSVLAAQLPVWLRLFPAVRTLTLKCGGPQFRNMLTLEENGSSSVSFLENLREACPELYIEWLQNDGS